MRRYAPPFLLLIVFVLALASCAEGGTAQVEPDAGPQSDASPSNQVNNQGDMTPNGPDASECGVCCPGDTMCIDETTLGVCSNSGEMVIKRDCDEGQECQNGACITPQLCMPGETECFDSTTLLTCRTSGLEFTSSPCPTNTTCFDGTCATGAPVGSACSDDSACVTANCHCGASTDEPCPDSITDGYCTSETCDFETCGEDGLCVAGSLASLGNAAADYDHCVPRCTTGTCEARFECRLLPIRTDEGIGWETGCYFPGLVDIGDECSNDGQCAPGSCLQNYFNTGYCTRRCDQDGSCPEGAACVELKNGEFYCSLLCGDGSITSTQDCPLEATEQRFDVTCTILDKVDGGVARACSSTL